MTKLKQIYKEIYYEIKYYLFLIKYYRLYKFLKHDKYAINEHILVKLKANIIANNELLKRINKL